MKLATLFFLTQLGAALMAFAAIGAAGMSGAAATWVGAGISLLVVFGGTAWWLARRCRAGLEALEAVVRAAGEQTGRPTGIAEFDQAARQLATHAEQLDEMAADRQRQSRELQAILMALDRRGSDRGGSSRELRGVLGSLGGCLKALSDQMHQNTLEVGRSAQEVADGAEAQGSAVVKTSTYIEQLSANIGDVSDHAEAVQTGIVGTRQSLGEAVDQMRQLAQGIERIRSHSESSEKKLRRLADPSRQISSIVARVGDIAARTDLLALNASIESIRAGEHGRGFAVVADEVRKLAEQAAQATREIAGLIDSMQMETQESIAAIARERSEAEAEAKLATTTEEILNQIRAQTDHHATRTKEITRAAHQQLQLTQDVVLAMEQISTAAKSNRRGADRAQWSVKSLAEATEQLDGEVERLCRCADSRRPVSRDASPEESHSGQGPVEAPPEEFAAADEPVGAPLVSGADFPMPGVSNTAGPIG